MDRRHFVLTSLAASTTLKMFAQTVARTPVPVAQVEIDPEGGGGRLLPQNFIGLSYETQQLSDPNFFAPGNQGLIAQFRELAPAGVLRLGGNTSDYGFWKPTPQSVPPPRPKRPYKVGDPPPDLSYAVTPKAVENLRGFLDASGWTCLYGINLGTNTPALAADEAAFVAKTLGSKLEYFQVGNEADRFGSTIRDQKTWNADTFLDEWLTFAYAILQRVPQARFGMPDIASNAKWFTTIGERLSKSPLRSQISCLTHHYYIGGPPSNPEMTVDFILKTDPRVKRDAALVRTAAQELGTQWRMTEGNTCYRGGKPGVSDVFAAALWSADYCLELASLGYSGVNLHGGDGQMVANSLGGKLPGDEMVHDDPASHPHPYYTPIAHIGDRYVAEPVSYGMRFAQQFAGSTLVPLKYDTAGVNASVYMGKRSDGRQIVGVINKDDIQPLSLSLPAAAASIENTSAAMLTATQVKVSPGRIEPGNVQTVGPYTMALITLV